MSKINIIIPNDLQPKDSDESLIINDSEVESIITNENKEGECSFIANKKNINTGKNKINKNKNLPEIKIEEKSKIAKLSDGYINSLYQNLGKNQNNNDSNNDQAKIISKINFENLFDIQNQDDVHVEKNNNKKSVDDFMNRLKNYKKEKLLSMTTPLSYSSSPQIENLKTTIPKTTKNRLATNSNSTKNHKKYSNKILNKEKKLINPKISNEKKKIYYKKISPQMIKNNENNKRPNLLNKQKKPIILNENRRNINIKNTKNNQYHKYNNSQKLTLKSNNENKESYLRKRLYNNSKTKKYPKNNNTLNQSLKQKKYNFVTSSIKDIKNIKNKSIITQCKNNLVNNSTSGNKNKTKNINNSPRIILINKINKEIDDLISQKKDNYSFFNPNKNLCFIGFCDILFDLGFLHIKESSIEDITKINTSLKDLETQPYTNKNILTKEFLFNEQMLLVSAWKTIKNNFNLVSKFDNLPQENEEISVNDMKLFILIITGLFNKNKNNFSSSVDSKNNGSFIENVNSNMKNKKILLSNSLNDFSRVNNTKIIRRNLVDQNIDNKSLYLNSNELIKTLEYGKIIHYKNIIKLKNYFKYFVELRKLNDLYHKESKKANKIYCFYKNQFTFRPKINKNDKILLYKFNPSMNFFERNEIIKKRIEQKLLKLERARSQDLLKECTFNPARNTKKYNSNFKNSKPKKEITDKLNKGVANISQNIQSAKNILKNDNIKNNSKIYSTTKISPNKNNFNLSIKSYKNNDKNIKENISNENKINSETHFQLKRSMFLNSPLRKDELLNKRLMELRNSNFKKIVNIYENNSREVISNKIKNNIKLLKNILEADKGNMRFDIEQKTNKDTFEKYKNPKFNDYNAFLNDEDNEPLFTVEIKIKNNIKTIEVFPDNIPEKLAYEFCAENNLGKASYEKIFNVIKTKLDEINGNFYLNTYGTNYYGNNYVDNNCYRNNKDNYYQGNLQNNKLNNYGEMQNDNNVKNDNNQNNNMKLLNNAENCEFQESDDNIEDKEQYFNSNQEKNAN